MTDITVIQRRLMSPMGKTNHASLASIKSYFFRAFFFNLGNADTERKG